MMTTQLYCLPTISGLNEMCAAGGGESKRYQLRLPFCPYEVICCCGESFISDNLPFSPVYRAVMRNPFFPVPDFHILGHFLNGYFPLIGKYQLPFSNTGKFRNFPFLPQVAVDTMLFHWHTEHFTG